MTAPIPVEELEVRAGKVYHSPSLPDGVRNLHFLRNGLYLGELKKDRYGKKVPKAAHGSVNLGKQTSSTKCIMEKVLSLYDQIVDPELQVRRMSITANHVIPEGEVQDEVMQYSLFDDVEAQEQKAKTGTRVLEERAPVAGSYPE